MFLSYKFAFCTATESEENDSSFYTMAVIAGAIKAIQEEKRMENALRIV